MSFVDSLKKGLFGSEDDYDDQYMDDGPQMVNNNNGLGVAGNEEEDEPEEGAAPKRNGKVVNIPSYAVEPGDIVAVREKSKSLEVIADNLAGFNHAKYPWIEWDESAKAGKLLHVPTREDIPENIKEQLIVELYSK